MAMGKMIVATRPRGRKNFVPRPVKKYVNNQIVRMGESRMRDYDLSTVFAVVGNTWVEQDVSTLAEGDALFNREGRTLRIKSLEIKCTLHAVDNPGNTFRIVIGLFSGTQNTPLATAGATIDNILVPEACRNYLIKKYYDKFITVSSDDPDRTFTYFKRFKKPLAIKYGDDTNTYPGTKLFVSMISDSGAVTHPYVACGYSLTRFIA